MEPSGAAIGVVHLGCASLPKGFVQDNIAAVNGFPNPKEIHEGPVWILPSLGEDVKKNWVMLARLYLVDTLRPEILICPSYITEPVSNLPFFS